MKNIELFYDKNVEKEWTRMDRHPADLGRGPQHRAASNKAGKKVKIYEKRNNKHS
jgi:hypothetical protein